MSNEAAPAVAGRPKRSTIESLAATLMARELVARIPEYASYAESEGFETLSAHVLDVTKHLAGREMDAGTAARLVEEKTMVSAPARTQALFEGLGKLHNDAAALLEGGWIRETTKEPPFEAPFARVGLDMGERLPRIGYAFRHPDLDARGLVMFVQTKRASFGGLPGELAPWEKIEGVEHVQAHDLPQVEARHRHMHALAARGELRTVEKLAGIEKAFAEAEFKEVAPVDRAHLLKSLYDGLGQAIADADAGSLRQVLNRLAGVAVAVAEVADQDLMSDAPEDQTRSGPTP
jgi:hypothetical protein